MDIMEDIKPVIRQFIIDNFLSGGDVNLKDDTSFLNDGIIDSTGILEMVTFIEETYEINVDDDDMIIENFDSLEAIAAFVKRNTNESC